MSVTEELKNDANSKGRFGRNKLVILLIGVILVSLSLVSIAMGLYYSSGAAQLDLSGPRYVDVRGNVVQDDTITSFPAAGGFDKKTFEDFLEAYDKHTKAVEHVNGYDPAAVNNDSFNLAPAPPPVE